MDYYFVGMGFANMDYYYYWTFFDPRLNNGVIEVGGLLCCRNRRTVRVGIN